MHSSMLRAGKHNNVLTPSKILAKITFLMRNTHNGSLLYGSNTFFRFFSDINTEYDGKRNIFKPQPAIKQPSVLL